MHILSPEKQTVPSDSAPTLRIQLLGAFCLEYTGVPLNTLTQARLQALLTYLLLHRHSPQPRKRLAFRFWSETDEAQAQTNLRQLLHHLRRVLPHAAQFLQIEPRTVGWRQAAPYTCDIADFEEALAQAAQAKHPPAARAALEKALQAYGGELLPGCYDEWLLPERERLHQAYLVTLENLLLLAERQQDYQASIVYAERLLREDPLQETTYLHLMRLHALNDDRASALRVYHTCATLLEQELDIAPNQEIQDAYKRLLKMDRPQTFSPSLSTPAKPTLVGRQTAWHTLQTTWRRAARGQASFVLISGEAGLGKTRLAEAFLEWAAQQGITTARTRGHAAEGQLAYTSVVELLRSPPVRESLEKLEPVWLTELGRVLPELRIQRPDLPPLEPIRSPLQRRHLFEALARAVLGDRGPRVILLDDLHWCDQDTLEWLHYLLHFDPQAKLLLLSCARSEDIGENQALAALELALRQSAYTALELEPLDPRDTLTLAGQVAAQPLDAGQAMRLYLYTEGNPLFIVETMRAHETSQTNPGGILKGFPTPPEPEVPSTMPPKMQAVLQQRLHRLSPAAQALASLAATFGRTFTFALLVHASGHDEETLVQLLDELWQRRIVRVEGPDYDFTHDRLREAAYAETSPARRQSFHRRVAGALEQRHTSALEGVSGEIAAHYEQAGHVDLAVAYYERAAQVAQQTFSYPEVIRLLHRGLALLSRWPTSLERNQRECSLLIGLGLALINTRGYGHPEVEQTFLRAWDLCQKFENLEQTVQVLASLWQCYYIRGASAQALEWAKRLAQKIETAQPAPFQVVGQFVMAESSAYRGDFTTAQAYAARGFARYDPQPPHLQSAFLGFDLGSGLLGNWALDLCLLGYPDQAHLKMQEARELATAFGQPLSLGRVRTITLVLYQLCGKVALILELTAATLKKTAAQDTPLTLAHNLVLSGWALAHEGQAEQGLAQIQQGIMVWKRAGAGIGLTYYLLLLAEACAFGGVYEAGLNAVAEAFAVVQTGGETWMEAELHRRKGELLLAWGGDEPEIEACFQRAQEIARDQQARLLELRAATSLARVWHRRGESAAAHQLLAELYAWFTEGGETADLRQAQALLATLSA